MAIGFSHVMVLTSFLENENWEVVAIFIFKMYIPINVHLISNH